jgi:ABC-2 type transport system ATP-binding protein
MDPHARATTWRLVRELRDRGVTVVLTTHAMDEAEQLCDRVAIVDHGRVLASGRLDDLLGESSVRIRASDLPTDARAGLARFGRLAPTNDDGWLSIAGVSHDAIPDVVAAIVAAGGRVHAVDPGRATLEDRYFELITGRTEATGETPA